MYILFKRVPVGCVGCVSLCNNDQVEFQFSVQIAKFFFRNVSFSEYRDKKKPCMHHFTLAVFQQNQICPPVTKFCNNHYF